MLKKGKDLTKPKDLEVTADVLEDEHELMMPFLLIYPNWKPPVSHVAKIIFAIDGGFSRQLSQAASNRAAIAWANAVGQWLCGLYALLRRLRRRSPQSKSQALQAMKDMVILDEKAEEDKVEDDILPLQDEETSEGSSGTSSSSDSESLQSKEAASEDDTVLQEWYMIHLRAECAGCAVCHDAAKKPWAPECQRQVAEEQDPSRHEASTEELEEFDEVLKSWYLEHLRAQCEGCDVCHQASQRPWAEECKKQVDAECHKDVNVEGGCKLEEDLEVHG